MKGRIRFDPKGRTARLTAAAVVTALLVCVAVVLWPREQPVRVTAYFPRTVGIYPGSDVRVLGVRVGEVTGIVPEGGRVRVELEYEPGRKIPADAQAAIINSSVVSDRYVQMLPVYRGGAVMRDGAVILKAARPCRWSWTGSSTVCTRRPRRSVRRAPTRTARSRGCWG